MRDPSERILTLEYEIRRLKLLAYVATSVVLLLVSLFLFKSSAAEAQSSDRVLRVRGIIIEDDAGRERVLIGAPIPAAQNRVRTNDARVREIWGKRYPNVDRYMNFYKDYRHATNGILILDENGFDRVAVGDPVPDPNIGKRIGPSTGIVINDEQGDERSGWGLLNVNGRHRVVLGLDSAQGGEALTLAAYDDPLQVGMTIRDRQHMMYVGTAPASDKLRGLEEAFYGFFVRGTEGTKALTPTDK
jgi:hypothetical protein